MENSLDGNTRSVCANPYCDKGENGQRSIVAVRDARSGPGYCSRGCGQAMRYKKRYKGTNAGPVNRETMRDKMNNL